MWFMITEKDSVFSLGQPANKADGICMELSEIGLSVCETELATGKVLYISSYQQEASFGTPGSLIGEGLKATRLQLKPYTKISVNYTGRQFTLVPTAFFDEKNARELLEFNCGDTGSGIILSDEVNADIRLVYSMDETLKSTIDRLFPNHHLRHTGSVLARLLLQSDELASEQVLLHTDQGSLFITAKKDGQLQLCNHYQVQTDEDILYYVLFVLEQFELNPAMVKVSLSGHTETDSSLSKALKKYIRHIRFVNGSRLIKRDDIASLPHHYYYTLLNRPFCE